MVKARHFVPESLRNWAVLALADGARPLLARGCAGPAPFVGGLKVETRGMTDSDQALLRSQGGPLVAALFTSCPTDRLFGIEPQCFRVLLLRRLR